LPEVSEATRATVVVSRGHCITKGVMFCLGQLSQEGNHCCVKRTLNHQESDVLSEVSEAKRATVVVSRGHCINKRVMFCLRSVKPKGQPLLCQEDTVSPKE